MDVFHILFLIVPSRYDVFYTYAVKCSMFTRKSGLTHVDPSILRNSTITELSLKLKLVEIKNSVP